MTDQSEIRRFKIDFDQLPKNFPTHRHSAEFWEELGRTVATFGFLEEVLGKAIFAFTATRRFPPDEIETEYKKWLLTLERALVDPLGGLIDSYGNAVRLNNEATISNLDDLILRLREATAWRNAICHGSWRALDERQRSVPFYVDRKRGVFETPVDVLSLAQVQQHVVELACAVINTVTLMGYQFPGSNGPGKPVFQP